MTETAEIQQALDGLLASKKELLSRLNAIDLQIGDLADGIMPMNGQTMTVPARTLALARAINGAQA